MKLINGVEIQKRRQKNRLEGQGIYRYTTDGWKTFKSSNLSQDCYLNQLHHIFGSNTSDSFKESVLHIF